MPGVVVLTNLCIITLTTNFARARLVICVARNFLNGVHGTLFGDVRGLPVGCFSAGPRNSVVDRCAGSVSALHRLISRSLPALLRTNVIIVAIFYVVLSCDILVALIIIIKIVTLALIAGGVNNNSTGCFVHRRGTVNGARNFVRRVVGKRGMVGIFYRRSGTVRSFSGIGSTLFSSDQHTRACTGVLNPVGVGVNGVLCMVVTAMNNLLFLGGTGGVDVLGVVNGSIPLAVNVMVTFLGVAGRFANGMGRLARRVGSVMVKLTNTRHMFTLVSHRPRISSNCIALIGTGCSRGTRVARYDRRANV